MSLQNVQVEFAELLVANEQQTDLVHPAANMIIYNNNLLSHLMNTLKNTYPLILKLLGEEAFKAAARDYIEHYPSTSGNLDEYGEYVSDFIANYTPADEFPYLADIARFEWAAHLLLNAADASAFDPQQLEQLTETDYADLRLILHPTCCVMQFDYPIPTIIDLCKGTIDQIETLEANRIHLLLSRRDHNIILTPISLADFQFLDKIQNGHILSDCLQAAYEADPSFELANKLVNWVKNQTIVDFILSS